MTPTDLNLPQLSRALDGRVIGSRIVHRTVVGSTMDVARELAERGEPEGAVVVAEEQSAGRGRFHRTWVSPRSQNLHFTALLRPTATQLPFVNMAATLATAHAASRFCNAQARVKWPNDVRIGGRKIAGILIETAASGARPRLRSRRHWRERELRSRRPPGDRGPGHEHPQRDGTHSVDRSAVLAALLARFDDLYAEVRRGDFAYAALGRHARNAGPPGAPELAGQHGGGTRRVRGRAWQPGAQDRRRHRVHRSRRRGDVADVGPRGGP